MRGAGTGHDLFVAIFSGDPLPDVSAAIVVAHPGDESISASWLMMRLQQRASVYCLAQAAHGCPGGVRSAGNERPLGAGTTAAAEVAHVPARQCHNLGLSEAELGRDLESLVWLTTAAVSEARPQVLVTHACEGRNLDHDATAFAVHLTARLMVRSHGIAPLVVELPRHGTVVVDGALAGGDDPLGPERQAVKVEFGPESRKVKRRMLQCHDPRLPIVGSAALQSESYVRGDGRTPLEGLPLADAAYPDAPWCRLTDFRRLAQEVVGLFNYAILPAGSAA